MNTNYDSQDQQKIGAGDGMRHNPYFTAKSPTLAGFLSMMPGLGQIYLGYYQLGFIHMAIFAVTVTALSMGVVGLEPLLGIFLGFFCLYNIIDAVRRASLVNQAMAEGKPAIIPEGFLMPGRGGTIAGGSVLIIIGTLILLESKFDVSMEWIEDWWSVLIIVGGAWLVVKGRKEKSEKV